MGKITIFVVLFLLVGAYLIKTSYDLNYKKDEDRTTFVWEFARWVLQIGGNVKNAVGYMIAMDWFPEGPNNETNSS